MPRLGSSEARWPPFTGERLFGSWFWDHYRAGSIISLGGLIARNPETAFWADTVTSVRAVAWWSRPRNPEGPTLRRGCYVYHQALRTGQPVPSLEVLLADADKIDLAPRFRSSASEGCLQGSG